MTAPVGTFAGVVCPSKIAETRSATPPAQVPLTRGFLVMGQTARVVGQNGVTRLNDQLDNHTSLKIKAASIAAAPKVALYSRCRR